jgi:hypothetical protein
MAHNTAYLFVADGKVIIGIHKRDTVIIHEYEILQLMLPIRQKPGFAVHSLQ